MDTLNIDLWTCDVGAESASPQAYADLLKTRVIESWDKGADVAVLPEYSWMGLERFVTGDEKLAGVAALFWDEIWPALKPEISRKDRAVVLGTVPYRTPAGTWRNRAPILCDGRELHQDKLCLTPWEKVFENGEALHVWSLHGVKFAVVICLDIEVPEISVALRGRGVDCLLVPSATENILGVERVGRCASGRAVELCAYVGVSQLVGKADSELVDVNVGRLAWHSPSQSAFKSAAREVTSSALLEDGFHRLRGTLNVKSLRRSRKMVVETNPAHLTPGTIFVQDETQ
ncbi:MAG: nitrilase-related carbon-nitrogen hydrolase [Roseimicrobium sp.]